MRKHRTKTPPLGGRSWQPYKFRSPLDDPYGVPFPRKTASRAEAAYYDARSFNYKLYHLENNDIAHLGQELRRARDANAWLVFPPEAPSGTPLCYIEIITGFPAADFIAALKVFYPTCFKSSFGWLEAPEASDPEYWAARDQAATGQSEGGDA